MSNLRKFWHLERRKHLYLAVMLVLLLIFAVLNNNRAVANFIVNKITTPLKTHIAGLTYLASFSIAEVICVIGVIAAGFFVLQTLVHLLVRPGKLAVLYSRVLLLLNIVLSIYVVFCLMWGVNYYADSFSDRSGIVGMPSQLSDLEYTTIYFAEQLNASSSDVKRDADGLFAEDIEEIFAISTNVYNNMENLFPFLKLPDREPKKVFFSSVMSRLGFTGIFCPFTAESNINMAQPLCSIPDTIAHELAHQRGVATEQEANFVGIVAGIESGYPAYEYSAYMSGFTYLSNALYIEDRMAWSAVWQMLSPEVTADLRSRSAYWLQYVDDTVRAVSDTVYDNFLKSYGQKLGLKSYGAVTDLLIAYYAE